MGGDVKRRMPTCRTHKQAIARTAWATSCLVPGYSSNGAFPHERSHLPENRDRRLLPTSIEDAIQGAVTQASKMHSKVNWFEVVETRGHISNGKVAHYQVVIKVGFRLED
jgi:dodecin